MTNMVEKMRACMTDLEKAIKEFDNARFDVLCEELKNNAYLLKTKEIDQADIDIDLESYSQDIDKLINLFYVIKSKLETLNK